MLVTSVWHRIRLVSAAVFKLRLIIELVTRTRVFEQASPVQCSMFGGLATCSAHHLPLSRYHIGWLVGLGPTTRAGFAWVAGLGCRSLMQKATGHFVWPNTRIEYVFRSNYAFHLKLFQCQVRFAQGRCPFCCCKSSRCMTRTHVSVRSHDHCLRNRFFLLCLTENEIKKRFHCYLKDKRI